MSEEKKVAILALVSTFLAKPSASHTDKDIASLHGKLVHVASIFPRIHPSLLSISHLADSFDDHRHAPRHLTATTISDLRWCRTIIQGADNERSLVPPEKVRLD